MPTTPAPANLAIVEGRLSRAPVTRTLASGDTVAELSVTVDRAGARADSVPVTVVAPPPSTGRLPAGTAVLVVGRVERRFWRAGGVTHSRTGIVARRVVPCSHGRRRAAVVRALVDELMAML